MLSRNQYTGINNRNYYSVAHIYRMYLIIGGIGLFVFFLVIRSYSQQSQESATDFSTSKMNFIKIEPKSSLEELKKQLIGAYIYNEESAKMFSGENCEGKKFVRESDLQKKHRIIRPGYMVTMDYIADRLNVHVNESFLIKDLKWG